MSMYLLHFKELFGCGNGDRDARAGNSGRDDKILPFLFSTLICDGCDSCEAFGGAVRFLDKPFTAVELRDAVFQMRRMKAPWSGRVCGRILSEELGQGWRGSDSDGSGISPIRVLAP